MLALDPAPLGQLAVVGVDDGAVAVDERTESVEGGERALDVDPSLRRLAAGDGVGGQPTLGVVDAVLQELARSANPAERTSKVAGGGDR